MYVMKTTPGKEHVFDEGTWREKRVWLAGHRELIEMTPAEFKEATSPNPPDWAKGFDYRRVSGQFAHHYVKEGGLHMTGLYMGEDRWGRPCVRYAKGEFQ